MLTNESSVCWKNRHLFEVKYEPRTMPKLRGGSEPDRRTNPAQGSAPAQPWAGCLNPVGIRLRGGGRQDACRGAVASSPADRSVFSPAGLRQVPAGTWQVLPGTQQVLA